MVPCLIGSGRLPLIRATRNRSITLPTRCARRPPTRPGSTVGGSPRSRRRSRTRTGQGPYGTSRWRKPRRSIGSKAFDLFRQALEVCGDCPARGQIHKNFGLVYGHSGDFPNAERELMKAQRPPSRQRRGSRSTSSRAPVAVSSVNSLGAMSSEPRGRVLRHSCSELGESVSLADCPGGIPNRGFEFSG